MTKLIIILIILTILSGCGSTVIDPQIIKVPIQTKCEPTQKITPIQEYPFDRATKEMALEEKNRLAMAELHLVRGQNRELKAALTECTK